MCLRLNQPLKFEECGTNGCLAFARQLANQMDENAIDDAFVVVNLDAVVNRLHQWRAMLPRIQPFYAVKCNNDPLLLRLLADLGCGFDCASRGEIDQIVGGGLAPSDRVIYANPCKTRAYIRHAEHMGIRRMTFDSAEELTKIRECHSAPELILRIAVSDPTAQCPLAIKFGCDLGDEADALLKRAHQMGMPVVGISFHVGSGCRDPTAFQTAVKASRHLFQLGFSLGHPMSVLDIGGGFPGHDTAQITFSEIVDVLHHSLDEYFPANGHHIPAVEIIAEPGRYFASSPISICTNIISTTKVLASRVTKRAEDGQREGQMLYINDSIYGSFNCILFDHFQPIGRPLFDDDDEGKQQLPTIVWGQTCDGLDQIEAQTRMRKLKAGEWLYYENMGAYTSVAASRFNGFRAPKPFYAISKQCWNAIYGTENDDQDVVVIKEHGAESGISSESEASGSSGS